MRTNGIECDYMNEERIKNMLNGIINKNERWRCRPLYACANYNSGCCNVDGLSCPFRVGRFYANWCRDYSAIRNEDLEWREYKLGEEIRNDWEYERIK